MACFAIVCISRATDRSLVANFRRIRNVEVVSGSCE